MRERLRHLHWIVPAVVVAAAVALGLWAIASEEAARDAERATQDAPMMALAPRHILYVGAPAARAIVGDSGGDLPPPLEDTYRQGPDRRRVMPPDLRLGKVTAEDIAGLAPHRVAETLRAAVADGGCGAEECTSHLVGFDDVNLQHRGVEGLVLSDALSRLEVESPYGGSVAERIHLYLDVDAFHDMARPLAAERWEAVGPALSRAGGIWIETYRSAGPGRLGPLTEAQWVAATRTVVQLARQGGSGSARIHYLLGPEPFADSVAKATATPLNRVVACSGVGAYDLDVQQARAWMGAVAALGRRCEGGPSAARRPR